TKGTGCRWRVWRWCSWECSRNGGRSEGELRAGEEGLLVFAVAACGATVEVGLCIVRDQLEVVVEIPVQADGPRRGPARRAAGIGIQRGGGIVDVQPPIARDQFERAPAAVPGGERVVGLDPAIGGLLAGQYPAAEQLPGTVVERGARARGGVHHVLAGADVLAQEADRPGVPVGLRRPACVRAVGGRAGAVAEEGRLSRGAVAGQEVVAAAVLVAGAGADAEAQPRPRTVAALP